jgi:hypothetical protein
MVDFYGGRIQVVDVVMGTLKGLGLTFTFIGETYNDKWNTTFMNMELE